MNTHTSTETMCAAAHANLLDGAALKEGLTMAAAGKHDLEAVRVR